MSSPSSPGSTAQPVQRTQVKDRFEATFVVSLDPLQGDFPSLQDAIRALPSTGGKIFVKAVVYPITSN